MVGKIEGIRTRGRQKMRWMDCMTDSMGMSVGRLRELVMNREALESCGPCGHKQSDTTDIMN